MKKIILAIVGSFPPPEQKLFGGIATSCKALLDAGLAEYCDLKLLDSTQRSVPPPHLGWRVIDALLRISKYFALLLESSPDAILIFSSPRFSFVEKSFLAVLGYLKGSRILFFPRGGQLMDDVRRHPLYARFVRALMAFPHRLLCQGEAWRDFFVHEMGLPAEKCVVIKNWTATNTLLEIGAKREYSEGARIRILFLGWLDRSKGIFELLDAFARLHNRFPLLELDIAGEGDASLAARLLVEKLGLSGSVNFLGWIEGNRKLTTLAKASIFCLPSHFEGLPNAMIEAMAAGLPVIVTPVGTIPDVIIHNHNGLISPVGNACALATHIEELIASPSMREQLGRAAYHTAAREFTGERAINQLLELLPH